MMDSKGLISYSVSPGIITLFLFCDVFASKVN